MSNRREIFIDTPEAIGRLADSLNAVLQAATPLQVKLARAQEQTWDFAEGQVDEHPIVLLESTGLDSEIGHGFRWYLSIDCWPRPNEGHEAFESRCDGFARTLMRRIGKALSVRCLLYRDLQHLIGEFP